MTQPPACAAPPASVTDRLAALRWPRWLPRLRRRSPVVPVVRLTGMIGQGSSFRPGLSLATAAPLLQRAFAVRRAAAVALVINSPGGSPVQSALIAQRIRDHAAEAKIPVLAFIEDVGASGGYWIALAADEIYADARSIVGSIGVVSAGFGFPDLLARHGIECRVYTAGRSKMILDPFQPEKPDDIARIRALQEDIHAGFKAFVRQRRGPHLRGDDAALFEGDFWTGSRALELGLIDGLGHLRPVLRGRFGPKLRTPLIAAGGGWLRGRRLFGGRLALPDGLPDRLPEALPRAAIDALLTAAEERTLWQRYGL